MERYHCTHWRTLHHNAICHTIVTVTLCNSHHSMELCNSHHSMSRFAIVITPCHVLQQSSLHGDLQQSSLHGALQQSSLHGALQQSLLHVTFCNSHHSMSRFATVITPCHVLQQSSLHVTFCNSHHSMELYNSHYSMSRVAIVITPCHALQQSSLHVTFCNSHHSMELYNSHHSMSRFAIVITPCHALQQSSLHVTLYNSHYLTSRFTTVITSRHALQQSSLHVTLYNNHHLTSRYNNHHLTSRYNSHHLTSRFTTIISSRHATTIITSRHATTVITSRHALQQSSHHVTLYNSHHSTSRFTTVITPLHVKLYNNHHSMESSRFYRHLPVLFGWTQIWPGFGWSSSSCPGGSTTHDGTLWVSPEPLVLQSSQSTELEVTQHTCRCAGLWRQRQRWPRSQCLPSRSWPRVRLSLPLVPPRLSTARAPSRADPLWRAHHGQVPAPPAVMCLGRPQWKDPSVVRPSESLAPLVSAIRLPLGIWTMKELVIIRDWQTEGITSRSNVQITSSGCISCRVMEFGLTRETLLQWQGKQLDKNLTSFTFMTGHFFAIFSQCSVKHCTRLSLKWQCPIVLCNIHQWSLF